MNPRRLRRWLAAAVLAAAAGAATARPAETVADGSEPEDEDAARDWLGRPAPDFSLDLLGGGRAELARHLDKDVVILDFWATWCGPCHKALPILAELAEAYRDKGVVLFAVDEREDAKTIGRFLSARKLELAVALDEQAKLGGRYGVDGIPHTVLIDRSGVIQSVHVGVAPDFRGKLRQELEALLAGKTLAKAQPKARAASAKGLEPAWSLEGRWKGVATDPERGAVYAVARGGSAAVVGADGKQQRELRLEGGGTLLRAARLTRNGGRELLSFAPWGDSVTASHASGQVHWIYAAGEGVDDVWPADLDGDGLDEVVVGYNGGAGVRLLDHEGRLLWKYDGIGNVWHVCAGDIDGDGAQKIVTTSAQGRVHLFDRGGRRLQDLDARCYASMVRLAGAPGKPPAIVVGGTGEASELLVALEAGGRWRWRIDLEGGREGHIDSAQAAPGRPWLAVMMRGGRLYVVDVTLGKIIGQADREGDRSEVGWLDRPGSEGPLLVVATGDALDAYRISAK